MALRSKNAHYALGEMQARHWHRLALMTGGIPVWNAMLEMVEGLEPALGRVESRLPGTFPIDVWDRISNGMRRHKKRFLDGVSRLE